MLEVQVTGDQHPKTFTIISDDAEAENALFLEALVTAFGDDDELAEEWRNKEADSDGCLRLIVPMQSAEIVGEMMVEDTQWPEEGEKILDTIKAARDEAAAEEASS